MMYDDQKLSRMISKTSRERIGTAGSLNCECECGPAMWYMAIGDVIRQRGMMDGGKVGII